MENLQANHPLLVDGLNEGFRAPDLGCIQSQSCHHSQGAIDRYIRTFFGRQKRFWEAARRK